MSKRVLILGAGYAGVEAALTLQKKKRKGDDIEISIIDKNTYHTLLTELHEVAGNRISEDGVIVPLKDIFRYTDVKIIKDEIKNFDFENNTLRSEDASYPYDYLVLAAGSEPNFFNIPGMKEHSFTLWSYEDALRIREHIKDCFTKAAQQTNADRRKSLLTFVVGGGGFTGVEMMGELGQWVKSLCLEHGISRREVRLVLVEALPNILNNLKEKGINASMRYLTKKLQVEVLTKAAVTNLDANAVSLKDGTVIPTNTLIWTAGVKASCITDEIDLEKGRTCRLQVNEYTQTHYKNVYAVGDISAFITEQGTLPALVESAIQTGNAAARNILAELRGKEKQVCKPKLHGVMVSVGAYFAATDLMGWQLPNLFAIMSKYLVNVHYLFGIGGFELVFKYLKHEFFGKKQRKFIIARHYSVKSQTFWLVPLRMFLGYAWLKEGITKINEGWLTTPMLAGLAPADAGSGASVSETGEKVFRIITENTPDWYAWIAEKLVIPNAMIFQFMIALAEVGLGIAFITGTFTFIAALASLALNANFLLSTGLYETSWWMIPAAICLLGGAGRAFGVDYYLMPYLMRQWRYFVRNRRIKLFLFR